MKIKVTQSNIKEGVPSSEDRCPIALAIKELFGPGIHVTVAGHISIGEAEFKLPVKADQFIGRFDDQKPVKPFEFNL